MEKKKINTYPRQDQVIDDMKAMHIARSYGDEGVRIIIAIQPLSMWTVLFFSDLMSRPNFSSKKNSSAF